MSALSMPTDAYEVQARAGGFVRVVGVDEAGRGALAGPVVAAAALLPDGCAIDRVRDSKLIPEAEREELYNDVVAQAICWGVGVVGSDEIDRINIRQATLRAMRVAVESLNPCADFALVDGRDLPPMAIPGRAIIAGDSLCLSIAAASIIAKVTRDRIMRRLDEQFPHYGLAMHKGYGTSFHRRAILDHGATSIHRRSFLGRLMQERLEL